MAEKTVEEMVKKGKVVKVEKEAESKEEREDRGEKVKKWKGKDWFTILTPKMFGETLLAETPATDPNSIIGRNVEVSVAEIMDNPNKYYMKLKFRLDSMDGKKIYTRFNGFSVLREYIIRSVRKGAEKVYGIGEFETKDGWKLQISTVTILNRASDLNIQKKVRKMIQEYLAEDSKKSTIDDFVKNVVEGVYQKHLRKTGNKIYPIRFMEIEKIEVMKAPAS